MIKRFLIAVFSAFAVAGCTTYKAVGTFEQHNEVLVGDVNHNLMTGGGTFTLVGKVTGMECTGTAIVTRMALTCKGQGGELYAECSDGRAITGQWHATSCTTGFGRGQDTTGAAFIFTFGHSEEEAVARIEKELPRVESKPSLPTYDPKSKRKEIGFSTGTGFFVDRKGFILTNYHVIEDAKEIVVITKDGKSHDGQLISRDPANDIAIIKIEGRFPVLPLVAAGDTRKAAEVMTLGYPLVQIQGQEQKATFGRINALSGVGDDIRFFQVDVPIQPGNSGGPLLNEYGDVIGIVTATLNQVNTYKQSGALPQNVNYAIKSDYALPLLSSVGIKQSVERSQKEDEFEDIIPSVERSIVLVVTR